jgi:hypothetical protein
MHLNLKLPIVAVLLKVILPATIQLWFIIIGNVAELFSKKYITSIE